MKNKAKNLIYKIKQVFQSSTSVEVVICAYFAALMLNSVVIFSEELGWGLALQIIRYICYFFLMCKMFVDIVWGYRPPITTILLWCLSILATFFSKNSNLLILVLIIMSLHDLDFTRLIEKIFKLETIIFIMVIILVLLGILPNLSFDGGGRLRYYLGFQWAADAPNYLMSIVMMYCYIKKEKSNIRILALLEAAAIVVYYFCDVRASIILTTLVILCTFFLKTSMYKKIKTSKKIRSFIKIMCYTLPSFFCAVSIILVAMFTQGSELAIKVDGMLSGRLYQTSKVYEQYGGSWLGQNIEWQGWGEYTSAIDRQDFSYRYVDIDYLRIFFDYGIVIGIIIVLGYTFLLIRAYHDKNEWLLLIIFIVLLESLIGSGLVNISKNVFVLAFVPILAETQKTHLKDKNKAIRTTGYKK